MNAVISGLTIGTKDFTKESQNPPFAGFEAVANLALPSFASGLTYTFFCRAGSNEIMPPVNNAPDSQMPKCWRKEVFTRRPTSA